MTPFEILISNDPESGNLVAEIWHEDEQVASLYGERSDIRIELYGPATGSTFLFSLEDLTNAIDWAKDRLTAMDGWDNDDPELIGSSLS